VGIPSVKDGRARFRAIVCKLLSDALEYHDKTGNCENYLTRLSDERMPVEQFGQLPDNNINLRILIVPGLLGECIADAAFPFETAMEQLRPLGYQIESLMVSGRSSSDYNAKQIARAVENLVLDKENYLILIGHSKGAVDILHFLVNYPELAHRVDAVVSAAGAINGSPLANRVADIYGKLGANFPIRECEPGDGGAFRSLERSARLTWMANNPLPASVKYYSVVSFTDRDRIKIILVTGAFAECFPKMGKPYQDAAARLEKLGYKIDTIVVSGRSSSGYNAAMIAETVDGVELEATERVILLGYSKGATDILHFLVDYPEHAKKVTAVLSVAGVINGTPLADKFADTYENWFQNTPTKACEPGDGGVLKSLKRSVQFPWLAVNPLPQNVRYFSIVAFTHRENVQPGLLFTYDLPRNIDPRNDGQVIFYDQIIPGGSLLGYINLDHWAIAVPVKEKTASSAWEDAATHPHVRALLFEAMILLLVEKITF
jgi:pimeloyl-ACP methyl ester carboxylesterase